MNKIPAFTLAEMMVVMLIISTAMILFTPVVVKTAKVAFPTVEHGRMECYRNENNEVIQEVYKGENNQLSSVNKGLNGSCIFKPKTDITNYMVEIIGGGAGGDKLSTPLHLDENDTATISNVKTSTTVTMKNKSEWQEDVEAAIAKNGGVPVLVKNYARLGEPGNGMWMIDKVVENSACDSAVLSVTDSSDINSCYLTNGCFIFSCNQGQNGQLGALFYTPIRVKKGTKINVTTASVDSDPQISVTDGYDESCTFFRSPKTKNAASAKYQSQTAPDFSPSYSCSGTKSYYQSNGSSDDSNIADSIEVLRDKLKNYVRTHSDITSYKKTEPATNTSQIQKSVTGDGEIDEVGTTLSVKREYSAGTNVILMALAGGSGRYKQYFVPAITYPLRLTPGKGGSSASNGGDSIIQKIDNENTEWLRAAGGISYSQTYFVRFGSLDGTFENSIPSEAYELMSHDNEDVTESMYIDSTYYGKGGHGSYTVPGYTAYSYRYTIYQKIDDSNSFYGKIKEFIRENNPLVYTKSAGGDANFDCLFSDGLKANGSICEPGNGNGGKIVISW